MSDKKKGWRRRLFGVARLAVAGSLLAFVFSRVHPEAAWAELTGAPNWIWLAVLGLFLVNSWLYAARVVVLMPERAPLLLVFRAVLVGNFAGIALPTGASEAAKVVTIAPHAGGADRALAFIAASRLIELVIWGGLVAWAAAAVLPGRIDVLVPLAWLFALGFVVGALALAVVFRHGGGVVQRLTWLPAKLRLFAAGASAPFADMAKSPGKLAASAAITGVFAATNCFTAWLILGVYGVEIPYWEVLGLIPTLDVFISLPLAPASIGVREVVFMEALAPYGADHATALAVGYTRMFGHFARAAIGGLLFVWVGAMSEQTPETPRGWAAQARAVFVMFHLIAVILMAIPAPAGGMKKSAWSDPTVQAEFAAWTARFNALGAGITQEQFETELWDFALGFMKARAQVLKPFQPYYHWCGTWQTWRMFIAPHRFPARLHIEVMEGGGEKDREWRTVYVARSREHDWLKPQLDQERMRSAMFRYGWSSYRRTYGEFADWVARRAAVEFPEASLVRLRMWKQRTRSPEEVREGVEPPGKWINVQMRELSSRREQ